MAESKKSVGGADRSLVYRLPTKTTEAAFDDVSASASASLSISASGANGGGGGGGGGTSGSRGGAVVSPSAASKDYGSLAAAGAAASSSSAGAAGHGGGIGGTGGNAGSSGQQYIARGVSGRGMGRGGGRAGAGGGRPASMNRTKLRPLADSIMRVNILDAETGVSVFEKIWKWKGVEQSEAIEALLKTFYQFAREIDDGEICRVQFATPTSSTMSRKHNARGQRRRGKGPSSGARDDAIGMVCERGPVISVVLFHAVDGEGGGQETQGTDEFVRAVQDKFAAMFEEILATEQVRTLLRDASKEGAAPDLANAVRGKFKSFSFDLLELLKASSLQGLVESA